MRVASGHGLRLILLNGGRSKAALVIPEPLLRLSGALLILALYPWGHDNLAIHGSYRRLYYLLVLRRIVRPGLRWPNVALAAPHFGYLLILGPQDVPRHGTRGLVQERHTVDRVACSNDLALLLVMLGSCERVNNLINGTSCVGA